MISPSAFLAENTLEAKEKLEKITAESDEIRGKSVRFPLLFWRKKYLWIKKSYIIPNGRYSSIQTAGVS